MVKEFDVIVIGAGSGLNVSSAASELGLKVAIVEEGPMGGTCLNRGCIPSKMIIHAADMIEELKAAKRIGVDIKGVSADFGKIIKRASELVDEDSKSIEQAITEDKNTTIFKGRGVFVGERTLQVGKETLKGKKIIIAAGTRPIIPQITGINEVPYLTSTEALRLQRQPKTITIIGGGYIAAELAHFFSALGTEVTIIQRDSFLLPNEDKEISELFTKLFSRRCRVLTGYVAIGVQKKGRDIITTVAPKNSAGNNKEIISEQLLVAVGRMPNTDFLDVKKAGISVNKAGYIMANQYLETTAANVWALGDIIGNFLFKHSANLEAQVAVKNALLGKKEAINYLAMPHAIFTYPQIAGVGETEQQLKVRKADYAAGKYEYIKTGMGAALDERDGFVKVYADRKTKKILGCHIIGPHASTLIHEVIVAMKLGATIDKFLEVVHVHPALSEVVQRAFGRIEF